MQICASAKFYTKYGLKNVVFHKKYKLQELLVLTLSKKNSYESLPISAKAKFRFSKNKKVATISKKIFQTMVARGKDRKTLILCGLWLHGCLARPTINPSQPILNPSQPIINPVSTHLNPFFLWSAGSALKHLTYTLIMRKPSERAGMCCTITVH